MSFLRKIGLDFFILFIGLFILLAWIKPEIGMRREGFSLEELASLGVSFIFFFYGLRLNKTKLLEGLKNIKLHLLIQISTFVVFPLCVLLPMQFFDIQRHYYEWLGFFFLAALPSTVSSSVVMVSIARGNIPAAIFNASISSLLGIFFTPIWMSIFINADKGGYPINTVLMKLVLQVLVPVCLGLMLNKFLGELAERYKKSLRIFDQSVILLIIYTSFCESFHSKMFDSYSVSKLAFVSLLVIAFFFFVYFIISRFANLFKFSREDKITAMFCGSKKSLVHGSVMSKVLVADPALAGVILLPTMLYHAFQLIIVSVIARKFGRK